MAQARSIGSGERLVDLLRGFQSVRRLSLELAEPLEPEDWVIQSMPDASPIKWHLAHTTWFFETFLLNPNLPGYRAFDDRFSFLFNSYYNALGDRLPRANRGLLSRPTNSQVRDYRAHVDEGMREFLSNQDDRLAEDVRGLILLGLSHEQQHQELMVTDLKHALALNPLQPAYRPGQGTAKSPPAVTDVRWLDYPEGVRRIGFDGPGFAFDNESPPHKVHLAAFQLASRPANCREYLQFIDDGGYRRPEFWLSEGWDTCKAQQWSAPLYWTRRHEEWSSYTLSGPRPIRPDEPVSHLSFFEADAFARWAGARLPTEAEWEIAARDLPITGRFLDPHVLHPQPAGDPDGCLQQIYGDVWEWTGSPYVAYPGFRPAAGTVGEYNGKFMCSQFVLRGGSCATPPGHIRPTYRNFFHPHCRWQFSGVRLARDVRPAD